MKSGIVYLVGAGPGDPGLLTIKAKELLEQADCVVYDALVSPAILGYVNETCERHFVGKRAQHHALPQEEINQLLVTCAQKHSITVRLKGGDPFVFGRGGEEALHLHYAKVPVHIVPGISSAIAAPAYAGIPVTQRGMATQFTVFTGHEMEGRSPEESQLDIRGIAQAEGTKIMLMGVKRLPVIIEQLLAEGQSADTPAALIQWGSTAKQKQVIGKVGNIVKLAEEAGISAPAVLVIGEVAQLNKQLNWWTERPLHGQRIVVTRTREQASKLSVALSTLGAEILEIPTIRIAPPSDRNAFAESVVDAPQYDWLIFTSPNGVKRFFQAFFAVYEDIREIGGARIAAVGPGTAAELKKVGLMVDVMPEKAVAEELIAAFDKKAEEFGGVEHTSMLWVHGEQARDTVYKELMKRKAIVDECLAYRTEPVSDDPTGALASFQQDGADWISFTSASTVHNWMKLGVPLPKYIKIASIGPITTEALAQHGLKPDIEAPKHNIPSLIKAIQKACLSS